MVEQSESVGVADHPDPSAAENNGRAATAGADRPALGPETIAEKLRNGLVILNAAGRALHAVVNVGASDDEKVDVGYRTTDIEALRRLVLSAIEQDETETRVASDLRAEIAALEVEVEDLPVARANLRHAHAEVRRLNAALRAPKVVGVSPYAGTVVVALDNGEAYCWSVPIPNDEKRRAQYEFDAVAGELKNWKHSWVPFYTPVPASRAAIERQSQESRA